MAKSEGPSICNFMHQTRRVGHSEHTRTFIPGLDAHTTFDKHTTFVFNLL